MKIAIAGKAGSGKSTAAKHLVAEYGFERVSLAAKLKDLCSAHKLPGKYDTEMSVWGHVIDLFPSPTHDEILAHVCNLIMIEFDRISPTEEKNRTLLQVVGTDIIREYHPTALVDYLIHATRHQDNLVLDDLRFRNEFHSLKRNDWVTVYCALPDAIRHQRLKTEYGQSPTLEQDNHPSECDLDSLPLTTWDYIINTAGSIENERAQVDELMVYLEAQDG